MNHVTLRDDLIAGLSGAIAGTPQAMAFALIAGIDPIYGLYTAIVSTVIGALFGSSIFMTVGPTNALSLVVASTLAGFDSVSGIERLFILTFLVGIFYVGFGVLHLGNLFRFVSNAVMTGFITGAALLIIFGQLRYLNGYEPSGDALLLRVLDWLLHLHLSDTYIVAISFMTAIIMLGLRRTRFRNLATLSGLLLASAVVVIFEWWSVTLVSDISMIPSGLPTPQLPDVALAGDLIPAALAIAILGAVQSAALVNTLPKTDGKQPHINRDFVGMGLGNLVGSFFQSMPACGSLSRTAVNVDAGARTRWANVFAGGFIALFLLAFGSAIEYVTLSALAVMLMSAAGSLIDLREIRLVWEAALSARIAMITTFTTALVLPIEYSIYVGVGLSLILYLYSSAEEVNVIRLIPVENDHFKVGPIPETLPDQEVVIFSIQGHLYFAAIAKLERLLPDPNHAKGCIVIIRLRDSAFLASTGIHFFERYDAALRQHGGRLILTGLSKPMLTQFRHATQTFDQSNLFDADEILLEGTRRAYNDAVQPMLKSLS